MLETLSIHAYIKGKIVEVLCNMANLGPTLFGGFFFFRLDIKLRNNSLLTSEHLSLQPKSDLVLTQQRIPTTHKLA